MSYWTHVYGTITVTPIGNTSNEKDTVLDNILANLPRVSGSEGDMTVYAMPKTREACKISSGKPIRKPFDVPAEYIIVVKGNLRDRHFDRTFIEFTKWMCRLAKRIEVSHTLVEISDYKRSYIIDNNNCAYSNMYVEPSDNSDS